MAKKKTATESPTVVPPMGGQEAKDLSLIEQAGDAGVRAAQDILSKDERPGWFKLAMLSQAKEEIAPRANQMEFAMFLYRCARMGVDPMAKQAYLIPFKEKDDDDEGLDTPKKTKHIMIVGIDGFRTCTRRMDRYSLTGPFWCGEDEVWKDVWIKTHQAKDSFGREVVVPLPPSASKVGIQFDGQTMPTWGVATYTEFCVMLWSRKLKVKVPGPMWLRAPGNQLAKCAEAQAHRKVNAHLLSGVYIREEMEKLLVGAESVPTKAGLEAAATVSSVASASVDGLIPVGQETTGFAEMLNKCETAADYKKLWDVQGPLFPDTATMRKGHQELVMHRNNKLGAAK